MYEGLPRKIIGSSGKHPVSALIFVDLYLVLCPYD
jgi:hypothetical protein